MLLWEGTRAVLRKLREASSGQARAAELARLQLPLARKGTGGKAVRAKGSRPEAG